MDGKVGRTVWAGVVIGVSLVLGNLALSLVNTRNLREESVSVMHSNELLLALDNVLSLVAEAEASQRGYVITGQASYLAPYKVAAASVQKQMSALEALTLGDTTQQALMADVRRHVGKKLGELDLTIGLRERKGFDLTKEVIDLGAGRAEMDALRATVAAMASHETQLLLVRESAAQRTYRFALATEIIAGLTAVLALLGFSWLLARYLWSRDRNEALIRTQREQLRTTLASIGDAVITTDADAKVTDLNGVAETLCGWSAAEAQGQPLAKVFHLVNDDPRVPAEDPVERALREGVVIGPASHTILVRKDGAKTPVDHSAAPIRDGAGRVFGCVLVFRDITGRKATERALSAARSRLERIVTDMAIPTMVYADDGKVLIVNRAWTSITGYAATELATLADWTAKAYGRRAAMMNTVIGSFFDLDRSVDNGEREIVTASGERRLWHFVTAPLGRDERGRRMLVTNAIDVTERKRLDSVLIESEARLRLAMDAANYGGWEWDPERGEVAWTEKTRELLGVGPDETPSMELFQSRVHPDDRGHREQAIANAWVSGMYGVEYRVLRADGGVRWISSRGRVVRDPEGGARLVGVIGDVTEQKQAVRALEDADRRKDEFLATLAHELRNPLAPLRNSLAIVQRAAADPAAFDKASGIMERQLSHLVRLIDDLLDVGRISLDKLVLRPEMSDLGAIVEHAIESCRPGIERAGHTLDVSLPPTPIRLRADRARLTQVFANLIGNAAKFTPDGGHLRIGVRRDGDRAVFSVSDDGIGIAASELPGIFEMFAQVDQSLERTHGGLGIGLTIARRLVELHGGSLVAASEGLGRGSEFTVSLPLAADAKVAADSDAATSAFADASGMPDKTRAAPRPLRILIVDDNHDSAESLATLLSFSGHDTRVAHDGAQALEAADAWRPEALLLDIGLPDINGFELCRRLRAMPWTTGVPMIALTGWGQEEDRRRSLDVGFDGHLIKPVELDELEAVLRKYTLR